MKPHNKQLAPRVKSEAMLESEAMLTASYKEDAAAAMADALVKNCELELLEHRAKLRIEAALHAMAAMIATGRNPSVTATMDAAAAMADAFVKRFVP